MYKLFYNSLFFIFTLLLFLTLYRSEFQNSGDEIEKYKKYYFIFIFFVLIFLLGFFTKKSIKLLILIFTITIIIILYIIETYTIILSYQIQKRKENYYFESEKKIYDKRSLSEYYEFNKINNKEIKVAVYPDLFNKKKNIDFFPLSGISNKETILCNENGYFVHYNSDRYGFRNKDTEWNKDTIDYLLVGDSLVHGFCVNEKYHMTTLLKKISNQSAINLSYGGNGPLIQLATLREYKPNRVNKIIWVYSEWNDLADISFEYNNPILKKYYVDKNFSQNLKNKQDIVDEIGNKMIHNISENKYLNIKNKIKNFIFLNNLRYITSTRTEFYIPDQNFKILENILIQLSQYSFENNAIPYFVYVPSYDTFSNSFNELRYKKILKIINKLDIELIDIREEIIRDKILIKDLFPYGLPGHYSVEGYRYLTSKIYKKTK
jgi:hypothetical protein